MNTGYNGIDDAATTRRMRRLAMLTAIVAIAPLCIVGVILTAESWTEGLIIAAGLLITLTVLKEWNLDGYTRNVIFGFVLTGGAWLLGALTLTGPLGFVPFALVGAMLIARVPNHRLLMTVSFSLGVGLVGATVVAPRQPTASLVDAYVLLPIAGTLFISGIIAMSEQSWQVVRRLERAKDAEAELAIARERMRFAGDLHDIQGHTLHVIKLKTALAQRLVDGDAERVRIELGEIRRLVDDTIKKSRELAYARHEIDFSIELENARRLCEAAGITVEVRHEAGAAVTMHPLLAHLLREATTNLLRHAHPTAVSIVVSPGRVEVSNDGLNDDAEPTLRGLARLRDRIQLAGGELQIRAIPGFFAVSATLDATDVSAPAQPEEGPK